MVSISGYFAVRVEGQDMLCRALLDSDTGALRCQLASNAQVDLDVPQKWTMATLEPMLLAAD